MHLMRNLLAGKRKYAFGLMLLLTAVISVAFSMECSDEEINKTGNRYLLGSLSILAFVGLFF
jgi:hypothetical protein